MLSALVLSLPPVLLPLILFLVLSLVSRQRVNIVYFIFHAYIVNPVSSATNIGEFSNHMHNNNYYCLGGIVGGALAGGIFLGIVSVLSIVLILSLLARQKSKQVSTCTVEPPLTDTHSL